MPSSVVARVVGDETVIVDLDSERYFTLNHTGATIWSALSAGMSAAKAEDDLVEQFGVARDAAASDVGELVGELVGLGLLEASA